MALEAIQAVTALEEQVKKQKEAAAAQNKQRLLEAQRREKKRVAVPVTLDFPALSFAEKKVVAAQFIRRIDVSEDGAEIIWNI